jgi:hypothetical protein
MCACGLGEVVECSLVITSVEFSMLYNERADCKEWQQPQWRALFVHLCNMELRDDVCIYLAVSSECAW